MTFSGSSLSFNSINGNSAGIGLTINTTGASNSSVSSSGIGANIGNLSVNSISGDTGTLTLSGTNTYTGTTSIGFGTLKIGGANAIPTATTLADSGTFDLNGFNQQVASVTGSGTVTDSGAAATFTLVNNAGETVSNLLTGTNFTFNDASTAGTVVLSNSSNSYGGGTTIGNGATISMSNGTVLGSGLVTINTTGTLNLPTGTTSVANNFNLSGTIGSTGNTTLNGTLTIPNNANAFINVASGNLFTVNSLIGNSTATLSMTGSSTWHLDSDSSGTYTGTLANLSIGDIRWWSAHA